MLETLHWVINTPGIGGLIVMSVATIALLIYVSSLLWLRRSPQLGALTDASEDAERSETNEA